MFKLYVINYNIYVIVHIKNYDITDNIIDFYNKLINGLFYVNYYDDYVKLIVNAIGIIIHKS